MYTSDCYSIILEEKEVSCFNSKSMKLLKLNKREDKKNVEDSSIKGASLKYIMNNVQAEKKGRYYLCDCPKCGYHEAWFYLDTKALKRGQLIIRCNRQSNCGEVTVLDFDKNNLDIEGIENIQNTAPKNPLKISSTLNLKDGITKKAYMRFLEELNKSTPPNNYRGISKEVFSPYITFYKSGIKSIIDKGGFSEEYQKARFYNRDIFIPIKNKYGQVDRCLFRSTKKVKLKEFQVDFIPGSNEIWNVKDLYDSSKKVIFICEGVIDALSIKEVIKKEPYRNRAGYIALTGVGKWSSIIEIIKLLKKQENTFNDRIFIICFDLDLAGVKNSKKFLNMLKDIKIGGNEISFQKAPLKEYDVEFHKKKNIRQPSKWYLFGTCDMNYWLLNDKRTLKETVSQYFLYF